MRSRYKIIIVTLLATGIAAVYGWREGWLALLYYRGLVDSAVDLDLASYRVSIDAKAIQGIASNASGLTYHEGRKTLFTVINGPATVAELSLGGELIRTIAVRGVTDIEAISHIDGDTFVIADEADHALLQTEIGESGELDLSGKARLTLALGPDENSGIEGASWDAANKRLLIVKEKNPLGIFEVEGLRAALAQGDKEMVSINRWNQPASGPLFLKDLSSLTYHEASGHTFLLSDESHLVVAFNRASEIAGSLVLRRGWHGLKETIPQAEGIAMTPDGQLFIISEPNLFYRFEPPSTANRHP